MSNFSKIKWTKNGEPLAPKALREMRYIMDGIKSGALAHEQGAWHVVTDWENEETGVCDAEEGTPCGTAHCFAGWCEYLGKRADSQKKSILAIPIEASKKVLAKIWPKYSDSYYSVEADGLGIDNNWEDADFYTIERWGLTDYEGIKLFDGNNKKSDLSAMVNKFEKGYRIEDEY